MSSSTNILKNGTVFFDVKTKNKSFIKVSAELKKNGIDSYLFPLMIYDRDLIGVDPFDENLSNEMKAKIAIEVKRNFWYFIREIARVPASGGDGIQFELHRGNLAMLFCLLLNLDTSIELPRQHYKTYSAVFFYIWTLLFNAKNYEIVFSNKSYSDTTRNLKRLTDVIDKDKKYIPAYLRSSMSPEDTNNQERLTLKKSNNTIRVVSPQNTREKADQAGRGMSTPLIWIDEMAFVKYCNVMYGALRPAFSTASGFAKKNGTPYSVLLTTTPKLVWALFLNRIIKSI